MFTLVMVLSLSSCGKIAEKVGDKVKEKAKDSIEKKLEEAGVDTDKLEEQVDKLKDELSEDSDSKDSDSKDGESKDDKSKDDKYSDDKSNEAKQDISGLDKSLTGIALIKACEPFLSNNPMNGEGSFYLHSKHYTTDDEELYGEYETNMYLSEGRDSSRIEIITDSVETTRTIIVDGEEGKSYMLFGNGTGYKMPNFFGGAENDDYGFDYTVDDEAIKSLKENLIEAKLIEFKGETVLYAKTKGMAYEFDNIWLSLERSIMVKYEAYNGDELVFSSEITEFEAGGDYSEMFKEPEGVEWMSMEEIGEMFKDE